MADGGQVPLGNGGQFTWIFQVRLHAYFHINLSTKEIATLLNIDPASVRRAKTRLLKKMGKGCAEDNNDEGGEEIDDMPI